MKTAFISSRNSFRTIQTGETHVANRRANDGTSAHIGIPQPWKRCINNGRRSRLLIGFRAVATVCVDGVPIRNYRHPWRPGIRSGRSCDLRHGKRVLLVLLHRREPCAYVFNAEQHRDYDVDRSLNWCFGISDCRGGWGVTVGRWGGYDCDGLVGSIDNRGGYAFAMNTFAQASALVPLARYDTRYARAIGKWMLNLANSARLFYPGALPPGHESSAFWKGDPAHVIAYEGLRREWQGKSPCATGDPVAMHWGPKTDLGLYGSSYVGMLGAIVRPTSVPRILQLDCLATDSFHDQAWPTFLCYNPYPAPRTFEFTAGARLSDLYDAVTRQVVKRNVRHKAKLTLPADSAALIIVVPAGSKLTRVGSQTRIDGVIVNYR